MDLMDHAFRAGLTEDFDDLLKALREHAKYKERSDLTHDKDHAPILAQNQPIKCLLLGHSFFERFKTTGCSTQFGPDNAPYPQLFNAGVGGDKICNVMYRLSDKGLLRSLETAGVEYALLAMGTNDLANDEKPLKQQHIDQYAVIIRVLRHACPDVKLLICGIAPKKCVKKEGIIEESNAMLEEMVKKCAVENSDIQFLPADPKLIDHLEPDGVHLNVTGYEMFAASLWERYQDMQAMYKSSDPYLFNGSFT